jgi:hypothetical protein
MLKEEKLLWCYNRAVPLMKGRGLGRKRGGCK